MEESFCAQKENSKDISRTWAEINLSAIRHNYEVMRARLKPETSFLGVVKANAYGHGAFQVAKTLEKAGADYLAVACFSEAKQLRETGISLPILILGITDPKYTEDLIRLNITAALGNTEDALAMNERALKLGSKVKVHLKVDSGMGRVGFTCHGNRNPEAEITKLLKLPGLDVEGIFTHFAMSDVPDDKGETYTKMQFDAFTTLIDCVEAASNFKFKIRHCTNSGAMINYEKTYLDMVRPGIALYGCYDTCQSELDLHPAMSVRSRIAQIKTFEEGDSVSYGRIYTAPGTRRIAIVPIGYADGLFRSLSGKIDMLVRGRRVKQVGRICMDMCMIDVTDVPEVVVGDIVTLFGHDGKEFISVEEQASKADTISYELLCSVAPRVNRIYYEE